MKNAKFERPFWAVGWPFSEIAGTDAQIESCAFLASAIIAAASCVLVTDLLNIRQNRDEQLQILLVLIWYLAYLGAYW